jgi:hypothetical protein
MATSGGSALLEVWARGCVEEWKRRGLVLKTRHDFAHDVLLGFGVSGNDFLGSLQALMGWMVAESGSELCDGHMGARFNPLNTTLRQPGSTNFNSVPVQNYPDWATGVHATVVSIQGFPRVAHVLASAGQTSVDVLWEVVGSQWGTSGRDAYNGLASFYLNKPHYNQLAVGV